LVRPAIPVFYGFAGQVPVSVPARGQCFADTRRPIAKTDIAVPTNGFGKLSKAAMLLGRDELPRSISAFFGGH
jgi:hypothetical protein